jgi:AcrR family transcriptional regulator
MIACRPFTRTVSRTARACTSASLALTCMGGPRSQNMRVAIVAISGGARAPTTRMSVRNQRGNDFTTTSGRLVFKINTNGRTLIRETIERKDVGMAIIDGRLARGARSRRTLMQFAVNAASVRGLDGLSIGGLAAEARISKSGVAGLFGTKRELQLATIAAAREIFIASVVEPTLAESGGRGRLERLISTWLDYSRNRVFAGGCFFAAAIVEVGSKPGPVRDAVAVAVDEWYAFVVRTVERAQAKGDLASSVASESLAFAIVAYLDQANSRSLIDGSDRPYEVAAAAARSLLDASRP